MAEPPQPPELIEKVGGVWAGPDLQREFQQEVADLLKRPVRNFPGAQPVSFAAKHLEELKREDYYVCEKTDGMRYLMYLTQDGPQDIHYLIDRKNDYYFFHTETILDGELVEDRYPDRPAVIKYLVFDCLVLDGKVLMERPLDKRLAYFKSHVLEPYKAMFKKTPPPVPPPFLVEDKSTEFSYALEKMFKEVIPTVKRLHGNDGLIFTCRNTPYKFGTDEHILKWKPPEENTIDFLLHITWTVFEPDPSDPDQSPQEDYLSFPERFDLYVYHGKDDYQFEAQLHVTPQEWEEMKALNRPLQDAIVECYLEPVSDSQGPSGGDNKGRWRFHRLRDDKTDGNHISTVRSVMESIQDHVTEDDLLREQDSIRSAWKTRDTLRRTSKG